MKHRHLSVVLTAAALLLSANLSFAAENKADAPQSAAKVTLVDINSATKEELKELPGVGDTDADKIIAGRPYATKAHLLTHKILPEGTYQGVKGLVIARQPNQDAAKNAAQYASEKK